MISLRFPLSLIGIVLASLSVNVTAFAAEPTRPPNVIIVLTDDLGYRDLGCYGSTYYKTPNIDRLAQTGTRFTDFYTAGPVCSPTRVSILTGKYPQRVNITDWIPGRSAEPGQQLAPPPIQTHLPLEELTLARALKTAGYATALVGKWHLGGKGFSPLEHGFDLNIGGDQTGTARSYFAPFRDKAGTMPGLETAPDGEYLTDRLTSEAIAFCEKNRAKPFFLYLAHYAPHTPLKAKPEIVAKYPGKPSHGKQSNPAYAAMVESIDEGVGRLIKKLDDLLLTDNTIVIFTSDNGGLATLEGMPFAPTYNGPLREGKGYLYEGGIRVPLIVKWPGTVKSGTISSELASSLDFYPTLIDACGVKSDVKLDGANLMPIFKGNSIAKRSLFWHYPHYSNQSGKPSGAIRDGDYKLIEFYEDGRRELFDVKKDSSESRNLILDKPDVAASLATKLNSWRTDVQARMPAPNPNFLPNPPKADGTILLHSRTAHVHGVQLRYEPLPHKDTLGFWVRAEDWASFEFALLKPGSYTVEVLQGCGKGSGSSEVELAVGEQKIAFTVKDTGGFQTFEAREVGSFKFDRAGRYTLSVKPKKKPGAAVMDLRQIVLKPVK